VTGRVCVRVCTAGLLTAFTFIVDHAMLLGVSTTRAALLLTVLGISSGPSRLLVGWVADWPSVDSVVLYTIALLVAGSSTCTLPSLRSYQLLCGYQVVYGICCGMWTTSSLISSTLSASCLINAQPLPAHCAATDDNSLIGCTSHELRDDWSLASTHFVDSRHPFRRSFGCVLFIEPDVLKTMYRSSSTIPVRFI